MNVLWQLVDRKKASGELSIVERREKVRAELAKMRQRVDEFNDYGELVIMQQALADVRAAQKKLADFQDQIVWINKEEALYKLTLTAFPEVEELAVLIDPFAKIFTVVTKWQRAEKRYVSDSELRKQSDVASLRQGGQPTLQLPLSHSGDSADLS